MSLSERIQWRPPKPDKILLSFEKRCRVAKEQPFLDEELMDDTTRACTWRNFHQPRLGRFKNQGGLAFIKLLGYGRDGIVWKVDADDHTYALKVVGLSYLSYISPFLANILLLTIKFWDNQAPPEHTRYWAIQRECQNASLLELMRCAIERSSDPIWLSPEPKTFHDAARNLHAFSDEGRSRQRFRETPGAVKYSTVPHLRKCYGWTMISGKELCALPPSMVSPRVRLDADMREISPSQDYHAIVYEYVSDSDHALDIEVVQAQLDLFWLAGFCLVPMRIENWKGAGVLVDMADLICPWHAGWFSSRYKRRHAREVM